jgi:hypothetical protein
VFAVCYLGRLNVEELLGDLAEHRNALGIAQSGGVEDVVTALHAALFNRAIEAAAPSVGLTVRSAPVRDDAAIEDAIAAQAREPGGGLIILPDSFAAHSDVIITAATRHSLPLIGTQEFPRAGDLMSYWFETVDVYDKRPPTSTASSTARIPPTCRSNNPRRYH